MANVTGEQFMEWKFEVRKELEKIHEKLDQILEGDDPYIDEIEAAKDAAGESGNKQAEEMLNQLGTGLRYLKKNKGKLKAQLEDDDEDESAEA